MVKYWWAIFINSYNNTPISHYGRMKSSERYTYIPTQCIQNMSFKQVKSLGAIFNLWGELTGWPENISDLRVRAQLEQKFYKIMKNEI